MLLPHYKNARLAIHQSFLLLLFKSLIADVKETPPHLAHLYGKAEIIRA